MGDILWIGIFASLLSVCAVASTRCSSAHHVSRPAVVGTKVEPKEAIKVILLIIVLGILYTGTLALGVWVVIEREKQMEVMEDK